jgi:hypothetical protein
MLPLLVFFLGFASPSPVLASNCNSLTRPQIEAALGRRLDPGTEEFTKFESTCTYSGGGVGVTISARHLTEPLDLPAELANLKAAFEGSALREVNGIAQRAYALEIPGAGTQLHILTAPREYVLISVMGDGDGAFDAAAKIARALFTAR